MLTSNINFKNFKNKIKIKSHDVKKNLNLLLKKKITFLVL